MTSRPFISCPLEAALAIKNFGIRLGHCHTKAGYYEMNLKEILQDTLDGDFDDIDFRLYILPESQPLLEPRELDEWRVGDWIYWIPSASDDPYEDNHVMSLEEIKEAIASGDKVCTLVFRDNVSFPAIQYEDALDELGKLDQELGLL